MAAELVAGTSQLLLMPLNTQRLKQLCTSFAGELLQVTAQSRGALVICNISERRPRGDHAKPRIEGSEFAQKRLGGKAHATVLPVARADSGAAPGRPEPIRFDDARQALPIFRPSPTRFRAVDLDLQTK